MIACVTMANTIGVIASTTGAMTTTTATFTTVITSMRSFFEDAAISAVEEVEPS